MKEPNNTKKAPCLWMQAGVVRQKTCKTDFECASCSYDMAMRRVAYENRQVKENGEASKGKRGKIVFWRDKLKELPLSKRPCVHHMKGRIEFRTCIHGYVCRDCDFDQYFYDQHTVHAVVRPVDVLDIEGFKIPQGYYLHRGHAWIKLEEGSEVRIGLDDFAMRLLGPFDKIESPLVGKEVKQGRPAVKMTRGPNNANALSPVSGVVTAINPRLRDQGNIAAEDPYSEGWIMRIQSGSIRRELKNLMIGDEAGDYVGDEVKRLHRIIEEDAGPLAADGGFLSEDIFGKMPQLKWKKLTWLFLRT